MGNIGILTFVHMMNDPPMEILFIYGCQYIYVVNIKWNKATFQSEAQISIWKVVCNITVEDC